MQKQNGYENLNKLIGKQDKNNLLRIDFRSKNLNGLTEDLILFTGRDLLNRTMIFK